MSQCAQILSGLKKGPMTPLDALRDYQCFRLAARIMELRDAGYNIQTDIIEKGGKRYAQYRLLS